MSHWPKEAIESLIEAYKSRPSLYVPESPNYHSRHLRRKYEEDIAKIVCSFRPGTTPIDIRNKIQGLRTAYLHERKKLDRAEMLSLETYVPSLWYFDKLKFLDKYMRPKTYINASLNAAELSPSGSSKDSSEDNKLEIHDLLQEQFKKNLTDLNSTDPLTCVSNDGHSSNAEDRSNYDIFEDSDIVLDTQNGARNNGKIYKKTAKRKQFLKSSTKRFKNKFSEKDSLSENRDIPGMPSHVENNHTQGQIFGKYVGWVIDNISDQDITMNLRHKIMVLINEAETQYRRGKNV